MPNPQLFSFTLEKDEKSILGADESRSFRVCDVECIKTKPLIIGEIPYLDNTICILHRNAMKAIEAYYIVMNNGNTKSWAGWSEWA